MSILHFPKNRHARASKGSGFAWSAAKVSRVIPLAPRRRAARVSDDQYSAGIERRAFQLLTTGAVTPHARATSEVPPRDVTMVPMSMGRIDTSPSVKMSRLHGSVKDFLAPPCFTSGMRKFSMPLTDMGMRMFQVRVFLQRSQADMAAMVGTTEGGWSDIERGKRCIAIERARVLYQKHGISLDWIYEGNPGNLSVLTRDALDAAKETILSNLREVQPEDKVKAS